MFQSLAGRKSDVVIPQVAKETRADFAIGFGKFPRQHRSHVILEAPKRSDHQPATKLVTSMIPVLFFSYILSPLKSREALAECTSGTKDRLLALEGSETSHTFPLKCLTGLVGPELVGLLLGFYHNLSYLARTVDEGSRLE